MLECCVYNTGGWARANWQYTLPTTNARQLASEIEQMGFKTEILPAWAARHWCYMMNVSSKADNTKGTEHEKWFRIAVAVEKWLITRAKRPENQKE